MSLNIRNYELCLLKGGIKTVEYWLSALSVFRPQSLFLTAAVIGNDGICSIKDILGRTVILLQFDHRGFRIMLLEIKDIPYVGTAESVY